MADDRKDKKEQMHDVADEAKKQPNSGVTKDTKKQLDSEVDRYENERQGHPEKNVPSGA